MRVSVFGLGYVGRISAACLTRDGHSVIGVDVESQEVAFADGDRFGIREPGWDQLIAETGSAAKFRTTHDARSAVLGSDISLICVGPSSNTNGSLNLQDLDAVCMRIGMALAAKEDYHLVVVRSAVLPGTVEGRLILLLEQHSGRQAGDDFGVCVNPPFSRRGSGAEDFDHPTQIVIGVLDERSGETAEQLYKSTNAPIIRTSIQTAEMLHYVNCAFRAVKVTFANEIGNLCAAHGIDSQEVMEYFCLDRRLNISSAYLRPGAFGEPCLPKNLRALMYRAKEQNVDCPLLAAVLPSNQKQIVRTIDLIERTRKSKVGILGLGFKAGGCDIRENPIVHVAEMLMGKGYQLRIFDEGIDLSRITAAKSFVDRELSHIIRLISPSREEVIRESEVLVIGDDNSAVRNLPELLLKDQILIDLAGVTRSVTMSPPKLPLTLNDQDTRESVSQ